MAAPGNVVILNGAPRSGKSSIARAIQDSFEGVWMHLGVDAVMAMTPARHQPGIGLRPGGERPDLEDLVGRSYAGLYEAVAAFARQGLNVVVDAGHHEEYSRPLGTLADAARRLAGLPVCAPIATVDRRRPDRRQPATIRAPSLPGRSA